jgi:hypothetical protein
LGQANEQAERFAPPIQRNFPMMPSAFMKRIVELRNKNAAPSLNGSAASLLCVHAMDAD